MKAKEEQDNSSEAEVTPSKKEEKKIPSYFEKVFEWGQSKFKNSEEEMNKILAPHIEKYQKEKGYGDFTLLFLVDDNNSIGPTHANKIYNALSNITEPKDIFFIIDSRGGSIESAYLISKICRKLCANKFIVSIPRRAKSAATLISLGADEIHMGLMSELGPIDPQIAGIPALGLSNALKIIAHLSEQFPGSAEMFSKYLKENLFLPQLGYLERMCESAEQYAYRLLSQNANLEEADAKHLSNHFVNHYKDHGFVIDCDEAQKLLGEATVKINEDMYNFANKIYTDLDFASAVSRVIKGKHFSFVGSTKDGTSLIDLEE